MSIVCQESWKLLAHSIARATIGWIEHDAIEISGDRLSFDLVYEMYSVRFRGVPPLEWLSNELAHAIELAVTLVDRHLSRSVA